MQGDQKMNYKAILGADQHSCCLLENDKTIVTDTHCSSSESSIKRACPPFFLCGSVAQSSVTLCDHTDCSLPDTSVHGISQARILKWVTILFSRGPSQPRDRTPVSCLPFLHWQADFFYHLSHLAIPILGWM